MFGFSKTQLLIVAAVLFVALSMYGDKTKTAKIPVVGGFIS